jgi:hypothetical protein
LDAKVKRLRALTENYAILAEPPLEQVGSLLAENRQLLRQDLQFLGRPWAELRRQAAQAARAAAVAYMQVASEPLPDLPEGPLLLAGHQPELFHPGVWIKNFALHRRAREQGCVPLNLIVDSDTAKSVKIHVPDGDHLASVPFDHSRADVPFEERAVEDEELFASLPERTAQFTKSWPFEPLLPSFWQEVLRQKRRTALLGERLAAARRTWERRWGCHNLELPMSKLCQTEPFAWFACHLLADLPRFHAVHNQAVQAYRAEHGIRSRFHPVPDLARLPAESGGDGRAGSVSDRNDAADWLEAPFWIWAHGQTRRERLFARLTADELQMRCGSDMVLSLPRPDRAPLEAVQRWLDLQRHTVKVRTRALLTTMFARLLVGDAFLHGIGGGKYDELTDVLIQQFFGITPPRYLVLSATLLLPLPHSPVSAEDLRFWTRRHRDWWWNPQRHFRGLRLPDVDELAREKQSWIERLCANAEERRARFLRLREINDRMHGLVEPMLMYHEKVVVAQKKSEFAVNQVLSRRDFAFCLYPEEELRRFLTK